MEKLTVYAENAQTLSYLLCYPENTSLEELPLLVYLHGAGERGEKLHHLYRHGVPYMISKGREYEAVVLCPQCPRDGVWDNVTVRLKNTIDQVIDKYQIKKDRILCTGSSMGGFGTWMMGLNYRNFFAGIGPVAGGGMSWRVGNLQTTPVFAVHGAQDPVVPPEYSLEMIRAMKAQGMKPELRVLEGYGHNDGILKAYEDGEIIDWLLQQRRTDFSNVPEAMEQYF